MTEIRPSFDIHIHFLSYLLHPSTPSDWRNHLLLILTRLLVHFYCSSLETTVATTTTTSTDGDDGMYLLIGKYLIESTKIINLRILGPSSSFIILPRQSFVRNDFYWCHTKEKNFCLSLSSLVVNSRSRENLAILSGERYCEGWSFFISEIDQRRSGAVWSRSCSVIVLDK